MEGEAPPPFNPNAFLRSVCWQSEAFGKPLSADDKKRLRAACSQSKQQAGEHLINSQTLDFSTIAGPGAAVAHARALIKSKLQPMELQLNLEGPPLDGGGGMVLLPLASWCRYSSNCAHKAHHAA